MNFVTKLAAIGVVAGSAIFASGAQAAPGTPVISNGGVATARFVGFSAADTDLLSVVMGPQNFFTNQTTAVGASQLLGTFAAGTEIQFSIFDQSIPATYFSGAASRNPDNSFHADVATNLAAIQGTSALTQASRDFAATITGGNTVFVAFEDRRVGTGNTDFNDLVFAVQFTNPPATVPEPASLALIGAGLIGLGAARRRKAA